MTIRVYLKKEMREQNGATMGSHYAEFKDTKLGSENGRRYLHLSSLDDRIPSELIEFVEEITMVEYFTTSAHREMGIYHHASAEGELDAAGGKFTLKIRGQTLADVRELYHQIRSGAIRPTESYEVMQSGESTPDLKTRLEGELTQAKQGEKNALAELESVGCRLHEERLASTRHEANWRQEITKNLNLAETITALKAKLDRRGLCMIIEPFAAIFIAGIVMAVLGYLRYR